MAYAEKRGESLARTLAWPQRNPRIQAGIQDAQGLRKTMAVIRSGHTQPFVR